MGKFGDWMNEKDPQALNELSALDRAQTKSNLAYRGVSDTKFNTAGGLVEIIQGELEQILKRRKSDDPTKDKNMVLKAMKVAYMNIVNSHKAKMAASQPTVPTE
jgi:hypothetical protein